MRCRGECRRRVGGHRIFFLFFLVFVLHNMHSGIEVGRHGNKEVWLTWKSSEEVQGLQRQTTSVVSSKIAIESCFVK